MQVSSRLKRLHENLHGGLATAVGYQAFAYDAGNVHAATGEVIDVSLSYPATLSLQARIEEAPSKALRQALGLGEDIMIVLRILVSDVEDEGVTLSTSDRFTIPGRDGHFYVEQIARKKQAGDKFLEYLVAVKHQAGDKRNR